MVSMFTLHMLFENFPHCGTNDGFSSLIFAYLSLDYLNLAYHIHAHHFVYFLKFCNLLIIFYSFIHSFIQCHKSKNFIEWCNRLCPVHAINLNLMWSSAGF